MKSNTRIVVSSAGVLSEKRRLLRLLIKCLPSASLFREMFSPRPLGFKYALSVPSAHVSHVFVLMLQAFKSLSHILAS